MLYTGATSWTSKYPLFMNNSIGYPYKRATFNSESRRTTFAFECWRQKYHSYFLGNMEKWRSNGRSFKERNAKACETWNSWHYLIGHTIIKIVQKYLNTSKWVLQYRIFLSSSKAQISTCQIIIRISLAPHGAKNADWIICRGKKKYKGSKYR